MLAEQVISLIDTAGVIAIIDVIIMIYTKYGLQPCLKALQSIFNKSW